MQEYHASIGSENRIKLPEEILKSYLTDNGEVYLAFKGAGCLGLCTPGQFEKLFKIISQDSGENTILVERSLFGRTKTRKISSDGRVRIPDPKKYGFKSSEVTILEVNRQLEIWDSEVYQENQSVLVQQSKDSISQKSKFPL